MAARHSPFHEKLRSRILERFRRGQAGIVGTVERVQQVDMLTFYLQQRLVARMCACGVSLTTRSASRCAVNHVLAIVEHEEDFLVAEKSQQAEQEDPVTAP